MRAYLEWTYPAPYTFYNTPPALREEDLEEYRACPDRWFAVLTPEGGMVGMMEYSFDGPEHMEIGLGLRPDAVGRGCGAAFTRWAVAFGRAQFDYDGPVFLRVADWNTRAIRAYEKAGFRALDKEPAQCHGQPVTFLRMVRTG